MHAMRASHPVAGPPATPVAAVPLRAPLRWGQRCLRPLCPRGRSSPGSHPVWLPGGALSAHSSSPKAPHQRVCPHPLLAWGPSATPRA